MTDQYIITEKLAKEVSEILERADRQPNKYALIKLLSSHPYNPQAEPLKKIVTDFVLKNEIGSSETIYQCDHVIENALEFIESLCDIVGYYDYDTKELRQEGKDES
jgi:hypothetical protein